MHLSLVALEEYKPSVCKKCCRIIEPTLEDFQCGFRPGRRTADQIFILQQVFQISFGVCQRCLRMFCRPQESIRPGLSRKLQKVLREYGVDGRLLLADKSLYYCAEVRDLCRRSWIITVHHGCWIPTAVCAVVTPLHVFYELDRLSRLSWLRKYQ